MSDVSVSMDLFPGPLFTNQYNPPFEVCIRSMCELRLSNSFSESQTIAACLIPRLWQGWVASGGTSVEPAIVTQAERDASGGKKRDGEK